MTRWKLFFLVLVAITALAFLYGTHVIRRGFSATDQPSTAEMVMARTVRNLGIPRAARDEKNPWTATPDVLQEARESFTDHCASCHGKDDNAAWKLVLFVRSIGLAPPQEKAEQSATAVVAHYVGSAACQKCHAEIYETWKKTPMANVVRDPREYPDAILPDLATNNVSPKFTKE